MARTSTINDILVVCAIVGVFALGGACNSDARQNDREWTADAQLEDAGDSSTGDDTDASRARPDADVAGSVDGSDAAEPGDTGGGDAGTKEGLVVVLQDPPQIEGTRRLAFGNFVKYGPKSDHDECIRRSEGGCRFEECPSPERSRLEFGSVDTLRVDGSERTVELTPRSQHVYDERGEGEIWNGTGTVRISATGGTVPGFDAELRVTSGVELLEPTIPPPDESMTIDRDQPMTVRWRGIDGYSGHFRAAILADRSDRNTSIVCRWSPDAGEAVIPTRLLQRLPATEDAHVRFGASDRRTIRSGKWEVLLHVQEFAEDGDPSTGVADGDARVK